MSKLYKKIINENSIIQAPTETSMRINNTVDAFDFFTSRKVFSNKPVNEAPMAYSSPEAKQQLDRDIVSMSNVLGKASQQVIKIMMDGVKSGKYDAMDIPRGIDTGPLNRTHEGERPFMKMLWRKVRSGFRRYSKSGKLR